MSALDENDIIHLHRLFTAPLSTMDCGERCAPHNEGGRPFCCDTRHAVPTAYCVEWQYLKNHSDLWRLWQGETQAETARLTQETPPGLVLIECRGHQTCQRDYRSLTCRAFPFFPYIDSRGNFLGLAYYREYRQRCWVISHLAEVTQEFKTQFCTAYEMLFERMPEEKENFAAHSAEMRKVYARSRQRIHILGRDGKAYAVSPKSEAMAEILIRDLPRYGVYQLIAGLPFPDERHDL